MKFLCFYGQIMIALGMLWSTAYADIACDNSTASLLDDNTLQLALKQVKVGAINVDADLNFQGTVNGKLTWKLGAVRQATAVLPADCQAQVYLAGNLVTLTKILTSNNRISYFANFELIVLNNEYFLVLKDYLIATAFVGQLRDVKGLVGFHIDEFGSAQSKVRIYVCDGLPTDQGGFALWFTGTVGDGSAGLSSVGSTNKITYQVAGSVVTGSISFADGRTSAFIAPVEFNGSGIYDVTVGSDGSYDGTSMRGDVLDAVMSEGVDGFFKITGILKPLGGATINVSETKTTKGPFATDAFTAVALVKNSRVAMAGRSGDIRKGLPGLNIIGFDYVEQDNL